MNKVQKSTVETVKSIQLSLFDEPKKQITLYTIKHYEITYEGHPYKKNGSLDRSKIEQWTENRLGRELKWMLEWIRRENMKLIKVKFIESKKINLDISK